MALSFMKAVMLEGFSRYLIHKDGKVYDLKDCRFLNECENNGYRYYHLRTDDGRAVNRMTHRLLAMSFVDFPIHLNENEKLEVNHINGVKSDDRIENLEWCTPTENMRHARLIGLTIKYNPVQIRNVKTGEVFKFEDRIACAQFLDITPDAVTHRSKSNGNLVFDGWQFRYANSHEDKYWPEPKERDILVRNVKTGQVTIFNLSIEVAEFMKVSPAAVSTWLRLEGQPVLPGYFQLKYIHDKAPWREIKDPEIELALFCNTKAIQIFNPSNGEKKVFSSARECAKYVGIRPTTLNMRLRANDNKGVYPDGYIYSYYSPAEEKSSV